MKFMVAKTILKAGIKYVKKRVAAAKTRKQTNSLDKYNIHVRGSSSKGPVPIKNQSLQKSTLSGRTYSVSNNRLSTKTMLDIGGGYGSTTTSRFQDSVKDLIGLDSASIKKAQRRLFKRKKKK